MGPFLLLVLAAALTSAAPSVYFVQFGMDDKADADWSGTVVCRDCSVASWQFNSRDALNGRSWKCTTRLENYWDTPYERRMRSTSNRDKVTRKGVFVSIDGTDGARVETKQGAFPLKPGRHLDGRALVSESARTNLVTQGSDAEDDPSLLEAKDGTLWLAYTTFSGTGDQVVVRRRTGGAWSDAEALAAAGGDYFRTAIAQDAAGKVWVVWSAQVDGNFDLYARAYDGRRWAPAERLTSASNSDIYHALARDRAGNLYLSYQSARSGNFDIHLRRYDGKKWSPEIQVSNDPANDWQPALAAAPDGSVTIMWDTYSAGNYDVVARTWRGGKLGPLTRITNSGAFESRVSAQYDRRGRLWLAWDEGDFNWGKDYGQVIEESGRGLLVKRQVRVAVLDGGRLLEPVPIAAAVPDDLRQVVHQPLLVLDSNDRPWVFFHTRINTPRSPGGARTLWRVQATVLDGNAWRPMIEFPTGYGRIDSPLAAVLRRDGTVEAVWTSDGRVWPAGAPLNQDLVHSILPAAAEAAAPSLSAYIAPAESPAPSHANEARDIDRIRAYRARANGKEFRIARGDIHRHTDISWDGNRDGSLHDGYRYALDAAAFDFVGVCDHQAGNMIPYNWWMIQKAADLFAIEGRFAPLYSYERSLGWPNGHRNVVFADRGRPVLAISAAESKGTEGAAKLYRYLRENRGLTTAHTTATGAGTDWRDSNREVEPVVEIYQGYRLSYETAGAPRAAAAAREDRFAAGMVWNAWAKGLKLGVQSSSDHVSTHISYAAFYVDRIDRRSLIDAMYARRTYAATDNIIVELRMGEQFMGADSAALAPLNVRVTGTGPIDRVDVIKSNRVVYSVPGKGAEAVFNYTDAEGGSGEAWYYVRVLQKDGQMAWSSPIWTVGW